MTVMIGKRVLMLMAWLVIVIGLSELVAAPGAVVELAAQELSGWVSGFGD
jgi:hypothetical protein